MRKPLRIAAVIVTAAALLIPSASPADAAGRRSKLGLSAPIVTATR